MPQSDGMSVFDAFDQPPEKAIELLKSIGIDKSGSWDEMMADANRRAFIIAKVMQADILEDMKRELERALEEGLPFSEFKKNARARLVRRGWTTDDEDETGEAAQLTDAWRLEVIYRANLQTSLMAGRFLGQLETKKERPYLMYSAIRDRRTSDLCSSLDQIIKPIDDPFWSTYYPPNHFLCRARAVSISEREMKRDGLTVTSDEDASKIAEPDKGFDRSPLEPFTPDIMKYSKGIAKQLKAALKS